MHDEMAVRIGHGVADHEEERDARLLVQTARGAVVQEVAALDVLHCEVGTPVRRGSPVEKTGDVGVIEAREDLPLRSKAAENEVGVHPQSHELDGGRQTEISVGPHAQIDSPHSPVPDLAND